MVIVSEAEVWIHRILSCKSKDYDEWKQIERECYDWLFETSEENQQEFDSSIAPDRLAMMLDELEDD